MSKREELLRLAERVEATTGPDRALDAMIHHEVSDGAGVGYAVNSPAYTTSLDAAMALVPARLRLILSEWDDEEYLRPHGPWQAVLSEPGADASFDMVRGYRCDHAAKAALAICAAALRARAAPSMSEI